MKSIARQGMAHADYVERLRAEVQALRIAGRIALDVLETTASGNTEYDRVSELAHHAAHELRRALGQTK